MTNPVRTTYTPEHLSAGGFPIIKEAGVLASGQNQPAGAVLGRITATGVYTLSLSTAEDGSQNPVAVLDEAVDATGGATPCVVRLTGEVNGSALKLGTGHTLASAKTVLRPLSIFIR